MDSLQYAIVDIETTGGNASGSRITEIAIIIHDGNAVIDRFETLVNPEKEIPAPIFALTGISNEMVSRAPIFDDIANKVFEMLSNRVFVAHNVNFDYSFVRHQLEESGFKWTAKKLCTVRAARKIKPGFRSYSLGNLCRNLDITIENRHRAGGDANATAILFKRLLEWDSDDEIGKMIKRNSQDQRLPPNLAPDDFERLPQKPGIYYFHNAEQKVIYVGKAVNIKKRVASHFTGNNINPQRQHFLRDIHGISFEVCATELMALLLECSEIKKLWPAYNRALKRFEPKFGLYHYEARNGYRYLSVGKIAGSNQCVEVFNSQYDGVNFLLKLSREFEIDFRFCKFATTTEGFQSSVVQVELPKIDDHNSRIERALEFIGASRQSFAIVDKGRTAEELSCIWVENGHFYGMGYMASDFGISEPSTVKEHVTRYKSNRYSMQIINAFAEKHPNKVLSAVQNNG